MNHTIRGIAVNRPLVSIILNNYNYGRFLGAAIESALQQNYENVEVVVVDDGSTDESRDVIASFGRQIVPLLKENGGQSSALNVGLAKSRGEVICLLDSDDLFLPGKVERVVEGLQQAPRGWCFHQLQWVDSTAQRDLGSARMPREYSTGLYDFRDEFARGKSQFSAPATSGLSFSRDLMEKMLPVPERIHIYSDNFLKYYALAFSPGYYYREFLGLQRIHDDNACTGKQLPMYRANRNLEIARGLREKFPALGATWDRLFASAIGEKWIEGGQVSELASDLRSYLTLVPVLQRPELLARVAYRTCKEQLKG